MPAFPWAPDVLPPGLPRPTNGFNSFLCLLPKALSESLERPAPAPLKHMRKTLYHPEKNFKILNMSGDAERWPDAGDHRLGTQRPAVDQRIEGSMSGLKTVAVCLQPVDGFHPWSAPLRSETHRPSRVQNQLRPIQLGLR